MKDTSLISLELLQLAQFDDGAEDGTIVYKVRLIPGNLTILRVAENGKLENSVDCAQLFEWRFEQGALLIDAGNKNDAQNIPSSLQGLGYSKNVLAMQKLYANPILQTTVEAQGYVGEALCCAFIPPLWLPALAFGTGEIFICCPICA